MQKRIRFLFFTFIYYCAQDAKNTCKQQSVFKNIPVAHQSNVTYFLRYQTIINAPCKKINRGVQNI